MKRIGVTVDVGVLAAHIAELCKANGITCKPGTRGRASCRGRWIACAPVRSVVTYAVALHELGHILGKRTARTRLDSEVNAWRWAHANALVWTDRMDAVRSHRLMSYVRWARGRQSRDTRGRVFITPDHPVFRYTNE